MSDKSSLANRLHRRLSAPSALMDRLGQMGLRFFLYRENLYFDPELNGEHNLLRRLKHLGFESKAVFDIGANVGRWTEEAMVLWPAARYHLFDPTDVACQSLRERFSGAANCHIYQVAVGDAEKQVSVFENTETNSHSFISEAGGGSTRMVPGDRLLELASEQVVDFCKIDTEGFDLKIIKSMEPSLRQHLYRVIQFEHYPLAMNYGMRFSEISSMLRSLGYRTGKLFPEGLRELKTDVDGWTHASGTNFVALAPELNDLFQKLITR